MMFAMICKTVCVGCHLADFKTDAVISCHVFFILYIITAGILHLAILKSNPFADICYNFLFHFLKEE